jgi:L-lactate dehydrogenase complex protein LldF
VFLQLLPRSSTAERMNPYTSMWTGVTPATGPQEFHLVLLDNGRTAALADEVGRQALRCIRCSACLNVCPVYERTGGHAYGSVYPGPIGAILSPQLRGVDSRGDASLPYASSLCGACYDVCPVAIDIPEVLVHLRVSGGRRRTSERHGTRRDPRAHPQRAVRRPPRIRGRDRRPRLPAKTRLAHAGADHRTARREPRRLPGPRASLQCRGASRDHRRSPRQARLQERRHPRPTSRRLADGAQRCDRDPRRAGPDRASAWTRSTP